MLLRRRHAADPNWRAIVTNKKHRLYNIGNIDRLAYKTNFFYALLLSVRPFFIFFSSLTIWYFLSSEILVYCSHFMYPIQKFIRSSYFKIVIVDLSVYTLISHAHECLRISCNRNRRINNNGEYGNGNFICSLVCGLFAIRSVFVLFSAAMKFNSICMRCKRVPFMSATRSSYDLYLRHYRRQRTYSFALDF